MFRVKILQYPSGDMICKYKLSVEGNFQSLCVLELLI